MNNTPVNSPLKANLKQQLQQDQATSTPSHMDNHAPKIEQQLDVEERIHQLNQRKQTLMQSNQDQQTKTSYAKGLLALLFLEIIGLFALIICVGAGWLVLPDWTLNIFATAVLLQTFGTVKMIVKYLFAK